MSDARFFTFRHAAEWSRGTSFHLEQAAGGLTIVRESIYKQLARQYFNPPQLGAPILDTVVDRNGRWYMLDEKGVFWRADLSSNHAEAIATWNGAQWDSWARMAVTSDSIIVLQQGESSRLQAMSGDRSQIKWSCDKWQGESFLGITMAADDKDGIWLLAKLSSASRLQLLQFDPAGAECGMIELPLDADADISDIFQNRFELSIGSQGRCWLLDRTLRLVVETGLSDGETRLLDTGELKSEGDLLSVCDGGPEAFWALLRRDNGSHRLARIGMNGTILEYGNVGNGKGDKIIGRKNGIDLWDARERCLYNIQPVSETAVWRTVGRRMGVWISRALDSGQPETEWHKVRIDGLGQSDTQYNVRYYASDREEVVIGPEKVKLEDYIHHSDIAPEVKLTALSGLWSRPLRDPEDALLIDAKGRYLWVFLELIGSEGHAPVVGSMEVHFPRESYLKYLPSIYEQHEPSRSFLSRYLSIFQTMIEDTDRQIAGVTRSLEPTIATGQSLKWLLHWIGIEAEDYWTEEQLRKLLLCAPQLYSMRGTKYAMETLLTIYTGEKPIILEYEQVRPLKENPELGEVTDHLYAADPHMFNVLVKAEHAETDMKRAAIQQLIEAFKPVFSSYKLVILQPWVYMDLHSYLGMNTVLSEPTLLSLDGQKSMPHHTITIDIGHDNRMDHHTRLGLDSRLE